MGVTHFGLWNEPNLEQFFEGSAEELVNNVVLPGYPALKDGCRDAGHNDCEPRQETVELKWD